jgi:hypothetical protein
VNNANVKSQTQRANPKECPERKGKRENAEFIKTKSESLIQAGKPVILIMGDENPFFYLPGWNRRRNARSNKKGSFVSARSSNLAER